MPYYETVFIARQDLSEKQVADLSEKFCKVLKDNGGSVLKTENWGLRNFAYKINKSRKGHYILIESDASGDAVIEMERLMRLDEDVVRSLTTRLDAPTEASSPMVKDNKDDKKKKEAA